MRLLIESYSRVLVTIFLAVVASDHVQAQPGMLRTTSGDGRVLVTHAADLVPSTAITCEAWFYLDLSAPGGTSYPTILRKNPGSESYLFRISNGLSGNFGFAIRLSSGNLFGFDPTTPVPQNSWHHYAATFDGTMVRMYLDGVQMLAQPLVGTILSTGGDLMIGGGGGSFETWHGNLDAVRIWSVARTQAQIQATMTSELSTMPGLVGSWNFNSGFQDSAGNHNGTVSGGITILPSTSPVTSTYLQSPLLAAIGTTLPFQIKTSAPLTPYVFDVSFSGSAPGIPLIPPYPNIPLNPPLLNFDLGATLPVGLLTGFTGTTNGMGDATASIALPNLPALAGLNISAAFITLDASSPIGIDKVSNGTTTHITGPVPAIASVSPSSLPQSGGTSLVLNGSNFQSGATVRINGVLATGVTLVNGSTLVCVAPAGAPGPATIQVSNPDGQSSPSIPGLTYVPNLAVTSLLPLVPITNQTVFVGGTGFVSGMTLLVGGQVVPIISFSPTILSFQMPAGARCNILLSLISPNGQNTAIAFNPSPLVGQVIGAAGPASGGGLFFILGDEFNPGTTVTVGSSPATILSSSLSSIVAQAPAGTVGPAQIAVRSASGCFVTATYVYQ